ncbi:MAG: FAD-binding protein [Chloroflexota bacterium]
MQVLVYTPQLNVSLVRTVQTVFKSATLAQRMPPPDERALVFCQQHDYHTLAALLPGYTHFPRVTELASTDGDIVRVWQRTHTAHRFITFQPPALVGLLPTALLPAPIGLHTFTPDIPQIPERECIMFTGAPEQIAAQFVAMLIDERIFHTPQEGIATHETAPLTEPPTLMESPIIVAGGRGIAFPPDYTGTFAQRAQRGMDTLIYPLAGAMGGAVAASRALIDSAGMDTALQVGQSGRAVSPELYVAVGISGAVQHMQGVAHARVIFAVNKDPDAPIFRVAHYGAVGDVYDIVPALVAAAWNRNYSGIAGMKGTPTKAE